MRRFTAAFGIGLLLLSAFEWTLGTRWWLAAAVMVFPHEVLIGPAMALVCATARDRAALLANLLSLSWLVFGLCGYNVAVAAPREGTITVASLNIHHASYGVDRVRRALEQCDASVICLQEAGLRHLTDRLYPGGRTGWNLTCAGELAILSRYLVIRTRVLNMGGEGRWRPLVAATL
ncbi:MAG: hypothetical protein FJX76_12440, partial [Armatimonadetes bacterium]|nr:hypothetical protein [Armatimonadota bacterium]